MSIHLYKHNEDAYRAVETMLEEKQMAAVIHPTGTGKSMIAFKLVEQHPHKHFLWLSPSEYIYKTQLENIDTQFSNIEYMSYSRLMKHEDSIDTLHPDYIIIDEFHRCGAAEWGKSVRKLLEAYPKAKRLGLSATNIRYLDNQRNMAEELFEGNIASEMTLGEAIVREILPEPKYVIAMYSYKKELEQLKKRIEGLSNPGLVSENEKLLEQLKRALEQADGLTEVFARQMTKPDGKYIVFCSGREHMDEMKSQVADWFSKVDKKPHIYTAYYNDASTSKAFAEFKKDTGSHLKLLYCIDMLNEGIHVDDVDGVILLRPTVSPIIYLQQIGRALSAGSKNQPVIFDLVNNFDSLYCIDCLKNEMQEAFLLYPDTHSPREHFEDRFRIIDETKDSREIFMRLQENLGSAWDTYYEAAKQWYEENGNLKIPKSYVTESGLTLGAWINTQRRVKSGNISGNLTWEKIQKLNDIGMIWDVTDSSWQEVLEELKCYRNTYGNLDIKAKYVSPTGFRLGSWINNMRFNRFKDEVQKISGPNYYFLYGFYYRQIGRFDKALEMLDKSMERRNNFSKAKREKVQVYIGMQEFQSAKELAKENYYNYMDNPYHIQAYFSCLIKSEKSKENREILNQLIDGLKKINTDVAKEMTLRCRAQVEAFYDGNEEEALSLIGQAIEMNSNIHYARIVKFDICERFDMLDEMRQIINFFEQPEYKNKYHNNIISFKAILLAKEGQIDEAVDFFRGNIRDYTEDAKDKFIAKLERYKDE